MGTFDVQIFEVSASKYLGTTDAVKDLKANISKAIEEANEISVFTPDSVEKAGFYIKGFSKIFKAAKLVNKEWTEPITATKKDIDQFFNMLVYEAEKVSKRLEGEVLEYGRKQREIADEARRVEQKRIEEEKLAQAIQKEDAGQKNVVIPIIPEVVVEETRVKTYAGVSDRKVATWELVDFSLLPDEYKIVNESKVGFERRSAGVETTTSTIPGIRFTVGYTLQKR